MKTTHVKFTSYISPPKHSECGPEEIEVVVEANYIPGDPGVRTFRNGDPGYPPTEAEVEITSVLKTDVSADFWFPQWRVVDFDTLPEVDQDRLRDAAIEKVEANQARIEAEMEAANDRRLEEIRTSRNSDRG